jgi:uncharacterized membrane protein YoaK (UPF0700 family)
MKESVASHHRRWVVALILLTSTTGVVDAASVLGLGRVFTGNMTGNLLFLGFSLARAQDVSIAASVLAVGGFTFGAGGGSRIVRAPGGCRWGFAVELLLLICAFALAALAWRVPLRDEGLLVLLAAALGIQGAVARGVLGKVSTVVLTSTLMAATADLVSEHTTSTTVQRIAAIAAMLTGAIAGALLLRRGLCWPIGAGALLVSLALALTWRAAPR